MSGPAAAARPRLLVLRALGLGDLLTAVPALRGLRRAHPGHEIVLAAPSSLRDAALATEAVDTLFPAQAPGRGVPTLTGWYGGPPDVAVDLHGNGPESHAALAALGPRRILSYASPTPTMSSAGAAPPVWRHEDHERERWCRLLAAYGIPADPADVRLPQPSRPSPAPGAVVVHPGAEAAARRWPARHHAIVVRRLLAEGCRVVVTGGPGEEELVADLARAAGLGPRDVMSGGLPFAELSALVAGAACLLSGDTGPAHLAVAHGTPSVTLFGPVAPRLWGPPPDPRHTALWHPGPPGDPHGAVPDPALMRIGTVEVLASVLAQVRRGRAGSRSAASESAGANGHG
ncbi:MULTISPECIES: glycosyltransferase family 9 protein [unclassified Streptomyces]|uniref:glycosyltransferase family 9 protein n=1 Tax=unclassified Streptomyces TaxID=2593676 RepID=UPI00331E2CBF